MSFLLFLIFFLQQNWSRRERKRSTWKWGGGEEVAQIMYTHVSKCENDKTTYLNNTKKRFSSLDNFFS
jgi:hypothetical protein